jgi:hypothetical protein
MLKNGVFWDVTPCDSCKVLTKATRRNIPEGAILHSHRRENLKSYLPNIIFQELPGATEKKHEGSIKEIRLPSQYWKNELHGYTTETLSRKSSFLIYLCSWSGTKSTIIVVIYWLIVPA